MRESRYEKETFLDKHIGKIFLIGLLSMPLSTVIRIIFNI